MEASQVSRRLGTLTPLICYTVVSDIYAVSAVSAVSVISTITVISNCHSYLYRFCHLNWLRRLCFSPSLLLSAYSISAISDLSKNSSLRSSLSSPVLTSYLCSFCHLHPLHRRCYIHIPHRLQYSIVLGSTQPPPLSPAFSTMHFPILCFSLQYSTPLRLLPSLFPPLFLSSSLPLHLSNKKHSSRATPLPYSV